MAVLVLYCRGAHLELAFSDLELVICALHSVADVGPVKQLLARARAFAFCSERGVTSSTQTRHFFIYVSHYCECDILIKAHAYTILAIADRYRSGHVSYHEDRRRKATDIGATVSAATRVSCD